MIYYKIYKQKRVVKGAMPIINILNFSPAMAPLYYKEQNPLQINVKT